VRVLIALDGNDASQHAARTAVQLLAGTADVDYLVVSVDDAAAAAMTPLAFGQVMPLGPVPAWPPPTLAEAPAVDTSEVPASQVLHEQGDPVTQICRAAEEHEVDLIVVGAHHKGLLERLVDPSVVPALLRSTARPVLVVPLDGENRGGPPA
jgi:nucleotide-binding universal stress UspA family protein